MLVWAGLGPPKLATTIAAGTVITIFTEDGNDKRYNNYMDLLAWKGSWRSDTENMWFPMPANRRIFIQVHTAMNIHGGLYIDAIGYN